MTAAGRTEVAQVSHSPRRLRLFALCLGLALTVFSQSSGSEAADTKLDLVVSPWRFLSQAVTLWNPTAASGELQDQAYGYLFPMGPFYLLGHLLGLPAWVTQRSWETALVVAAFLGVVRMARLLGVSGYWPRIAAGLAFALAPRVLSELGTISSELLPAAALPWILIPLIRAETRGSPRRAAALSGIALLFAGGINASATLAVLPVPAIWLLTRARGPRKRTLIRWWSGAVVLSCAWWAIPLVVLGKYSPPFLNWIESSVVTTTPTSLIATVRGADQWQAYLGPQVLPGAWIFVSAPAAIIATALVAALGLAGLGARPRPTSRFLFATLGCGVVLVTFGHVSTIGPLFAGHERVLLDGALNAFRNVHKFDPVVRLPLAVGVGYACVALSRLPIAATVRRQRIEVVTRPRLVSCMVLVAVAVVGVTPLVAGRIVPQTRGLNDPSWWRQTGQWLGDHGAQGRALVVPGAAQPFYLWGSPRDDALQPYADGPWAVRDVAPLGQPGYVRLLDAVESELAGGRSDPAMPVLLARAGIRYLVVRNDLDAVGSDATALPYVHATIESTPGLQLVTGFGPSFTTADSHKLVDLGLSKSEHAVQIYRNTAWSGPVSAVSASGVVSANGSSDELTTLVDAGLGVNRPVVFGPHQPVPGVAQQTVLTDGIRRRAAQFSTVDRYSGTMTSSESFKTVRAAHDFLPSDPGPLSTYDYLGASITASSSGSDDGALINRSPANAPFAAVDGVAATAWRSGTFGAVGQWLELRLATATRASQAQLAFAPSTTGYPTRIRVTTEAGSVQQEVAANDRTQDLQLPTGATTSIRITVLAMSDRSAGISVGISTLAVPGVTVQRTLVVGGSSTPSVIAFAAPPGQRAECLSARKLVACDPGFRSSGEEDTGIDRTITIADNAAYAVDVGLRISGRTAGSLLDAGNPLTAIASSTDSTDPRERPGAAVDANASTAWVAAAQDKNPTIAVSWARPDELTGVLINRSGVAPVTAPTRVRIVAGTESFVASVPATGRITFPRPVRARSLRVSVLKATLRASTDSTTGVARLLPVGIAEIRPIGAGVPAPAAASSVSVACGLGPTLKINQTSDPLQLDGVPAADVLAGNVVHAQLCGGDQVSLARGEVRISVSALTWAAPVTIRLSGLGGYLPDSTGDAVPFSIRSWGATSRSLNIGTGSHAAVLTVRENANPGWQATLQGRRLPSITIDGWEQGYVLPAHAHGTIHLVFAPQRTFVLGLIVGLLAVFALLALAWVPGRRRATSAVPIPVEPATGMRGLSVALMVASLLIGGVAGLVTGAVVVVVVRRFRRTPPVWAAPALFAIAGLVEAYRPAGSPHVLAGSAGVQLLVLLALLAAAARGLAPAPRLGEAEQRSFEEVPADSGDDRRGDGGE